MKKLLVSAILATAAMSAQAADEATMALYNKSCVACHASGAANAPKTGDAAAWAPRMEKGMEAMVASVNNGMNAMPPKGMCMDCSAEQYQALIEFMAQPQ